MRKLGWPRRCRASALRGRLVPRVARPSARRRKSCPLHSRPALGPQPRGARQPEKRDRNGAHRSVPRGSTAIRAEAPRMLGHRLRLPLWNGDRRASRRCGSRRVAPPCLGLGNRWRQEPPSQRSAHPLSRDSYVHARGSRRIAGTVGFQTGSGTREARPVESTAATIGSTPISTRLTAAIARRDDPLLPFLADQHVGLTETDGAPGKHDACRLLRTDRPALAEGCPVPMRKGA